MNGESRRHGIHDARRLKWFAAKGKRQRQVRAWARCIAKHGDLFRDGSVNCGSCGPIAEAQRTGKETA